MNQAQVTEAYETYQQKIGDRTPLYQVIAKEFNVNRALYPGSHIDVVPSQFIPHVIYVDSFKGAIHFFKELEAVQEMMNERKTYVEPCTITFFGQDYTNPLNIEPVDLIISQYAGFVGQATKQYLKTGGILLCNDSHGDATLTRFDEAFEFIGVIGDEYRIDRTGLDEYFQRTNKEAVKLEEVRRRMKGPAYKNRVENYLFRKK